MQVMPFSLRPPPGGLSILRGPLHEMSAIGTKRTWASAPRMSAIGGKADIARKGGYVH